MRADLDSPQVFSWNVIASTTLTAALQVFDTPGIKSNLHELLSRYNIQDRGHSISGHGLVVNAGVEETNAI